jgi:hypothetical protein
MNILDERAMYEHAANTSANTPHPSIGDGCGDRPRFPQPGVVARDSSGTPRLAWWVGVGVLGLRGGSYIAGLPLPYVRPSPCYCRQRDLSQAGGSGPKNPSPSDPPRLGMSWSVYKKTSGPTLLKRYWW